jgi:hypothetical protein
MTHYITYEYLNFSFMEDEHIGNMIKDALHAVENVPGGMEEMKQDPGSRGFMFSTVSDIRKRIDIKLSETPTGGIHSGASYGWTMRQVQAIARLGWNAYVSQYLAHINLPNINNNNNNNNNNIHYISEKKKSILENVNISVCSICLCNNDEYCYTINSRPFENLNSIERISCGHVFHKVCLNRWISRHNTCPMCRSEIISLYNFDY